MPGARGPIDWTPPILEGRLVLLRPYDATADFEPLWQMLHDPEGKDLTATTADFTEEQIRQWLDTITGPGERLDLVIVERSTGEYAGEAVINEWDAATGSANFRIGLRGPTYFGRGLGSEATVLLADYALSTLGLSRLTLTVLTRNPRAIRTYEKAGFVETSRCDEDGETWVEMARWAQSR